MPTRYKWYAVVFSIAVILTVILLTMDVSMAPNPAQTTVPVEENSDYQASPENEKPMAEEGGPYR